MTLLTRFNRLPENIRIALLFESAILISCLAIIVAVVIDPAENRSQADFLVPSVIFCLVALHLNAVIRGNQRHQDLLSKLLLVCAICFWILIWQNREVAMSLSPAVIAGTAFFVRGRLMLLYSLMTLTVIILVWQLNPETDSTIASRALIACCFVSATVYLYQRQIEHNEEVSKNLASLQSKRNQLFGMVAHELRTPVATISMMAEDEDKEIWTSRRTEIKQTSQDLLNTIDDMRLLINPDLDRPVRNELFNIEVLNSRIASSLASLVASTGVSYKQFNNLPRYLNEEQLISDTYRLRVAITNLLQNACLHSEGSEVWLLTRLYTSGEGQQFLEWCVGDNGVGIPEDQISQLFLAGARGETKAPGTGLGLHICQSWIEEIGGNVEYRHRNNAGSEFLVRVPLVMAKEEKPEEPEQEESALLEALLPELNLLLVEDEKLLRMLADKLLSPLVAKVTLAENGIQGLKAFDPSFDLILTDYFMPEMSGVEMIREMRAQGYQGVILGITAATIGEQQQELIDAGADYVLPKPLTVNQFKEVLSKLIQAGKFSSSLSGDES